MTSLIKNQILKHLSKFVKNLSHDQIHLSTLKGEGELRNLELDEKLLTDLLELPSWLRLSRTTCNRVSIRIQWTRLKSVPIHLSLDEVHVEVETCQDLRPTSDGLCRSAVPSYASGSHYGFIDKVVDGVTLTVNSVILTLRSHAFTASIQLSRIVVDSRSPTWQKSDLRMTRLKNPDRGEILIFKELSWQTLRIEAKSTMNEELAPLRLITNQARCRITIKKKVSDCSVLGCRLVLILDDLAWVLTDDQLKAALHFADSLSSLIKRATDLTQRVKGARKLESLWVEQNALRRGTKAGKAKKAFQQPESEASLAAKIFSKYDVFETSYHFYSDRIDLHLCDDQGGKGRSCHPRLLEGGAFRVSLSKLQVDAYPYHLASSAGDRSNWIRYTPGSSHSTWLEQSLSVFRSALLQTAGEVVSQPSNARSHVPLSRTQHASSSTFGLPSIFSSSPSSGSCRTSDQSVEPTTATGSDNNVKEVLLGQLKKLMTTNLVFRLNNLSVWKVSTSTSKNKPKEFISGDRKRFSLPDDMPVIHFEYTQFYYPGDMEFPIPPPKLFVFCNPIQVSLDIMTVLWLNAFALNLQRSVKMLSIEETEPLYLDVKVEAIMFRILIETEEEEAQHEKQRDRPRSMHVQASRVLASNFRSIGQTGSKADLAKCLNVFQESQMFFGTDFPNENSDIPVVCDEFVRHATSCHDRFVRTDVDVAKVPSDGDSQTPLWPIMKKDLLWRDSRDVWHISLDPLWIDFHGTPACPDRPLSLVDAFPVSLWIYLKPNDEPLGRQRVVASRAKIHILAHVQTLVSVQLNHYQLLFLLRFLETIGEMTTFLTHDVKLILGEDADDSSVALGLVIPQVDVSLLMPSISQSRDAIGGEYDDTTSCAFQKDTSSVYSVGDLVKNVEDICGDTDISGGLESVSQSLTITANSSSTTPRDTLALSASASPEHFLNKDDLDETDTKKKLLNANHTPAIHLPTTTSVLSNSEILAFKRKRDSLSSSMSNMVSQLESSVRMSNLVPHTERDDESFKSDDSGDSGNFVIVSQSEDSSVDATLFAVRSAAASKRESPVEMAAEATEDNIDGKDVSPKVQAVDTTSAKRDDVVVSVATFHLGRLELAQQSVNGRSCIKLQGASFSGEECPVISWEEFQTKFSVRSKGWSESSLSPPSSWCFKLRLSTSAPSYQEMRSMLVNTSMSLKEKISRSTEVFLKLKAQNIPLQFYMSTLTGLVDLFEDEIIPTPMPMEISLENIALHLLEDRPSPNITSPGTLPLDVAIPSISITRNKSGLFCIQQLGCPEDENVTCPEIYKASEATSKMTHHLNLVRSGVASIETELEERASLLAVDNANLRTLLDNTTAELKILSAKCKELVDKQNTLETMQERAIELEQENKSLKHTLKYLQQELVKSGKKNWVNQSHNT